jgi:hypothetical protein
MTHFILKQYLHVDLKGSEPEGFALQQRLPDLYYSKLLPAIEKALDKCSIPGMVMVIDRLEIDAGTIDLERIDQDLAALVVEALIPRIQDEAARDITLGENMAQNIFYREQDGNIWEAFIYFLKNGFLPWSYKLPADKNLEELLAELLINELPYRSNPLPIERITDALTSSLYVKRLCMQFSESFIKLLLEKIAGGITKEIESLVEDLKIISLPPADFIQVKTSILEKSVFLISSGRSISKEEISKQVLEELRVKPDLFLKISNAFEHTWLEIKPSENKLAPSQVDKGEEISDEEIKEGIYIDNAGLILLHPFLPRFFETLGIANKSEIIQTEKALALLHYLTTGQTNTPEYELVLPKILCNIPLSTPIPSEIEITQNEKDEASALLDAVIKHWEALRDTSRDGLRGSFLIRPGKLSLKDDDDWLIQVESRTFDILLEQLPWGISMIKLPWMNKMLWVEWR